MDVGDGRRILTLTDFVRDLFLDGEGLPLFSYESVVVYEVNAALSVRTFKSNGDFNKVFPAVHHVIKFNDF